MKPFSAARDLKLLPQICLSGGHRNAIESVPQFHLPSIAFRLPYLLYPLRNFDVNCPT